MGVELTSEKAESYEVQDLNLSDSELTRHVRDALRSVPLGDSDNYDQLIGVLQNIEPGEGALLVTSLKALSGAVSSIDSVLHRKLLSTIFGMNMWNHGPDVLDALVELITFLAASNGNFVDACLEMLLSNFKPPNAVLYILKQPRGIAKKNHVLSRVHSALTSIADLVPLAPLRLLNIIPQRMPNVFSREPKDPIVIYVENMLRLESSALGEIVGSTVLKSMIDMLVDLDVEIGWDDILQDDPSKGIFQMELEELDETSNEAEDDDDDVEIRRERLIRSSLEKNIVADRLDSLMVVMFEHLQTCVDSGRLEEVFETLLFSFQTTVLPAYKSKFSQFVMFYACSLDPENCGVRFPLVLADIFTCSSYPPENRMISVAYLASYLSRAKFAPVSLIITMLKRLVDWCVDYCESEHIHLNPATHKVYYSGCQAIMYVLCFRMRSMMDVPLLRSELLLMPIETILKHSLNPLTVCLPCIVEEFLQQAKAAGLYVSGTFVFNGFLESELSRAFGGPKRLDMFFPFDPCLLKNSDRLIRPNFVYWSMVRETYDDEDECSSDDEHEGVGDYDIEADGFNCSLDKMSITPKIYQFGGRVNAPNRMPARIRPSTSPESL